MFRTSTLFGTVTMTTLFPAAHGDAAPYAVERLNGGEPIVTRQMFADAGVSSEGANINGPCVIAVSDWLRPRLESSAAAANYLLYFGHHQGNYIRMAWAERIDGPYHLYQSCGDVPAGRRGVLDLGSDDRIDLANGLSIHEHIASPHVRLDHERRRVEMYFHGPARHSGSDIGQKTFAAVSDDGLSFAGGVAPVALGFAYFNVFDLAGRTYAVASRGMLYQSPRGDPWTAPAGFDYKHELWTAEGTNPSDNPFQRALDAESPSDVERARHFSARVVGDRIEFYYTRVGDAPERVLLSIIATDADGDGFPDPMTQWATSQPPMEVLRPEVAWEGANAPTRPSKDGRVGGVANQLRDPFIFEDDGRLYLFYAGGGESGIGVVRLIPKPPSAVPTGAAALLSAARRRPGR